jgi:hypothetical protein
MVEKKQKVLLSASLELKNLGVLYHLVLHEFWRLSFAQDFMFSNEPYVHIFT